MLKERLTNFLKNFNEQFQATHSSIIEFAAFFKLFSKQLMVLNSALKETANGCALISQQLQEQLQFSNYQNFLQVFTTSGLELCPDSQ